MAKIIPLSFYKKTDVIQIAKSLLGKFLFKRVDNTLCGGMIVETECYKGIIDKASHAYNRRYTKRTKTLYEPGGVAYVYMCYGIHHLFNIVTNKKNVPEAVLIRALEPFFGISTMQKKSKSLTSGPGALCAALNITKKQDNLPLLKEIWLEDRGIFIKEDQIVQSPRVGVAYAQEDAFLPYRFRIKGNKWASKAK